MGGRTRNMGVTQMARCEHTATSQRPRHDEAIRQQLKAMLRVQADDRGKQRLRPGSLLGHSVSEGAEVTVLHARMSKDAQYSCVFSISSYLHTNEGGCALPIWNLTLAFIVQEKYQHRTPDPLPSVTA